MRTLRTPETKCPKCGAILDAASTPQLDSPQPEDLTICLYCSALLKFNRQLQPVALGEIELAQMLAKDPGLATDLRKALSAVSAIQKMRSDRHA